MFNISSKFIYLISYRVRNCVSVYSDMQIKFLKEQRPLTIYFEEKIQLLALCQIVQLVPDICPIVWHFHEFYDL